MFATRISLKHYTPPTCTLEIYTLNSLFPWQKRASISENFNFELHFDDPRLPQEKRTAIVGDCSELNLLFERANNYLENFLQKELIDNNSPNNNFDSLEISQADIYILPDPMGLLHHKLYYKSKNRDREQNIIDLTTSQLFDLVNALENYHTDLKKNQNRANQPSLKFNFFPMGAALVICGTLWLIWWRDRQLMVQQNQRTQELNRENASITSNWIDLESPESLDPATLPNIPSPLQLPPAIKNRQQLLPPPAIAIASSNSNTSSSQENSQNQDNQKITVLSPPNPPLAPLPATPPMLPVPTVIAIDANPNAGTSVLKPQIPESVPILTAKNQPDYPPVPTDLAGASSVVEANYPQRRNDANPVSPLSLSSLSKANSQDATIQKEVSQYFQAKWQPPATLTQSLQYRLKLDADGVVESIVPMTQSSKTLLPEIGIDLMEVRGEKLLFSATPTTNTTVRLILSPNGNVETFKERSLNN